MPVFRHSEIAQIIVRKVCAAFALCSIVTFTGCLIGPDYYGPPPTPVGESWTAVIDGEEAAAQGKYEGAEAEQTTNLSRKAIEAEAVEVAWEDRASDAEILEKVDMHSPELALWWSEFNDPTLDQLIDMTVEGNRDLRSAGYRILQYQARRCTVRADLLPQIDTDAIFYHQQTPNPGGMNPDNINDLWSWGTNLSWEIDVFGRLRRLLEAADADTCTAVEQYRDTMIIIMAETATNYANARAYQKMIKIVHENIAIQRKTLEIAELRLKGRTHNELDVAQARANLKSSEAELPSLKAGYRRALNRLSTLVGCPPGEIDRLFETEAPIPHSPERIAVGLPAELLRRRPDIRAAEERVAASTARIGGAMGELYPKFSINGTFGLDARDFSRLFHSDSINTGIGPSVRWNILNFGKFRCNVVAQEAHQQEQIESYSQTVLRAAEEVDNALTDYVREIQRQRSLVATVEAYRRATELSTIQYSQGTVDFQRVLDSQRALLTFQNQQVQSEVSVTNNLILLYRALGGGWKSPEYEGVFYEEVDLVAEPLAEPVPVMQEAVPMVIGGNNGE